MTPRERRAALVRAALELAGEQEGVLARRQLYALGVTRWQVTAQLKAGRWRRTGRQTVATERPTAAGRRWVAVLETGPRAAVDGVSSLQAAGLTGISEAVVHVIAPKSSSPRGSRGVRVHESRRFSEADVLRNGLRRTRPAVACIHAALWAVTDRQAQLYVVATVQQRLASVEQLHEVLETVRRHRRRRLLRHVLADVAAGAEALGEVDLLRGLRRRGLPQPDRQVVLLRPSGVAYLDAVWEDREVSLELDGAQHDAPAARFDDVLRDLDVAATGRLVVRLPLWAYRLDEDAVLDRLAALLRARQGRRSA